MLIELLREASTADPDKAVILPAAGEPVSYVECLARSERLAQGLRRRGINRFACLVRDPADVIALLCAASAVGAEPCLYPPDLGDAGIGELSTAFDHRVVVGDRPVAVDGVETVGLGDLAPHDSGDPAVADRPAAAPVLILTSGTTGRPKGARHDWARLAARPRAGRRPGPADPAGARWLLAYNLNQFAGIQVLLHVLATGATLVVGASNQPRDALAAMRRTGVTHVSATPTFWRFVTGLLDEATAAELPLQQITLGGEAVPEHVLGELRRLFPAVKISQIYASTESGSGLSVADVSNGLPAAVLDRGDDADVAMRIVDGQLEIRSRVGMVGYYGEPELGDDHWRPTGDLVELRDGRIHFVGRAFETINVGGVKVHPLPVEEAVGAVAGVEVAHAYGRKNPMTGQIVAVDVVVRPGADTEVVEDAIRAACEVLPPAAQPRRIRFVDALDLTGGKIARKAGP